MKQSERTLALNWVLLLALTLVSTEFSKLSADIGNGFIGAAVISIAFFKARIIALDFMELRRAPVALRMIMEGWLWLTWMVLVAMLLLGPA